MSALLETAPAAVTLDDVRAVLDDRKARMVWDHLLAQPMRYSVRDIAAVHGLNWRSVWNFIDRALASICYGVEPDGQPMTTSSHTARRRIFCALDPELRATLSKEWDPAIVAELCPAVAPHQDQLASNSPGDLHDTGIV